MHLNYEMVNSAQFLLAISVFRLCWQGLFTKLWVCERN